jgi:hypothetical protein
MRKIIHNLRRQPDETKRHILHVFTFCSAIILILLWIYSLGTTLTSPSVQTKINKDMAPFSVLKANLIGGYNSITEPNPNISQ